MCYNDTHTHTHTHRQTHTYTETHTMMLMTLELRVNSSSINDQSLISKPCRPMHPSQCWLAVLEMPQASRLCHQILLVKNIFKSLKYNRINRLFKFVTESLLAGGAGFDCLFGCVSKNLTLRILTVKKNIKKQV